MFYKELNQLKTVIVIFILVFFALSLTMMAFKPMYDDLVKLYSKSASELSSTSMEAMAESMKGIAKVPEGVSENVWFVATQWNGKNFGQFIPLMALIFALPMICREREKKTLSILLSRVSRKNIITVKYLAGLSSLLFVILIGNITGPLAMNLFGYGTNLFGGMYAFLNQTVAGTFIFSLFFLISVISGEILKPMILGIIAVIAVPIISVFSWASFLNIYEYLSGIKTLLMFGSESLYTAVLLVLSALSFLLSLTIFEREEF